MVRSSAANHVVQLTFKGRFHRDEFDSVIAKVRVVGRAYAAHADDGPGVREQDLPRIFQRHFSARPEAGSRGNGVALADQHYGLGLWIARRNVEGMTGTMQASNRAEGGFAVTVRFKSVA